MSEGTAAAEFAALLGELKERSGLSYGVLAKRLHMSTSTLHRYCNGDAVPADYAPVERLARLCKASPEELVELHRRWVLADAGRGRKGGGGSPEPVVAEAEGEAEPAGAGAGAAVVAVADGPASEAVPEERPRSRRPRPALLAGIAVAVVLGGVGLAVAVPSGGADEDGRRGAAAVSDGGRTPDGGAVASASPSGSSSAGTGKDKGKGKGKDKGNSKSEDGGKGSASASPAPRAPAGGEGNGRPGRTGAPAAGSVPLTVNTTAHAWEDPCSQRYLVNRPPGQVGPPPLEQDAPAWVAAAGAVPSGQQLLKLTVQGTGKETVVVDGLTVRMVAKRTPLAWNDYAMGYPGVGCGGGVPTRFFTVALDAARPSVVPEAGHDDFPFSVSQSDPEVYYVRADASAYDVSWYLELSWSSGSRQGTLTVDDKGRPFRTSGNNGRPAYEFPLGGDKWVEEGTTE
ncbi:helix-turn-helix domain-containing protein [Streptomyces sp. NPDC050546]|uniref:helix-turn-helix domain-containing protein n=1 Tax=Streptomyces sp. NPDC050546 TaxID=3365628 RepID=UPI0037A4E00A